MTLVETMSDKYSALLADYRLLVRRSAARIVATLSPKGDSAEFCRVAVVTECTRSFERNMRKTPFLALSCTRHTGGLQDYLASYPARTTLLDLSMFVFRMDVEEFLIRNYGSRYPVILAYNGLMNGQTAA